MIPGLTTALPIEIDDETLDLSAASNVYVTLKQTRAKITITSDNVTIDGNTVTAYFSQEDTLRFVDGEDAEGQINWIYNESGTISRGGTDPFTVDVGKQLLRRVLP